MEVIIFYFLPQTWVLSFIDYLPPSAANLIQYSTQDGHLAYWNKNKFVGWEP